MCTANITTHGSTRSNNYNASARYTITFSTTIVVTISTVVIVRNVDTIITIVTIVTIANISFVDASNVRTTTVATTT
jgi:hypothetical protein